MQISNQPMRSMHEHKLCSVFIKSKRNGLCFWDLPPQKSLEFIADDVRKQGVVLHGCTTAAEIFSVLSGKKSKGGNGSECSF